MEENDINKMFEQTTNSKKTSKPTPMFVMRQFYKSYSRSHKPKSQPDLNIETKNKSSIKKFTMFLNNVTKNSRVMTERAADSKLNELKERPCFQNLQNRTLKPVYYKNEKGECPKRQYFKDSFTKFHPFFNAHPRIKKVHKTQQNSQSRDDINICKKQNMLGISPNRTMTNLFREMKENKLEMVAQKEQKRNRFKEIRHNWIIDKLHKKFDEREWTGKNQIRGGQNFETTKQNIFPRALSRQ